MIDTIYHTSSSTIQPLQHSERYGLERRFIAAMGGVLYPVANLLVQQPATPLAQQNAAPTFEFYRFEPNASKKDQLIAMCDGLLGHYPSLGGDDGVRPLLNKLPPL